MSVSVKVKKGGSRELDIALRKLKREIDNMGLLKEVKERQTYKKPSVKKKEKKDRARKRKMKELAEKRRNSKNRRNI